MSDRRQFAFELVVVLTGILAAVALVVYLSQQQSSTLQRRQADAEEREAVRVCVRDGGVATRDRLSKFVNCDRGS